MQNESNKQKYLEVVPVRSNVHTSTRTVRRWKSGNNKLSTNLLALFQQICVIRIQYYIASKYFLEKKCIHRFRLRIGSGMCDLIGFSALRTGLCRALPKMARVSSVRGTAMLCGPAKSITGATTAGPRKALAKKESENIDLKFDKFDKFDICKLPTLRRIQQNSTGFNQQDNRGEVV